MTKRTETDAVQAVSRSTKYLRKILVRVPMLECIRFGKVVHIELVRRLPTIHSDGTVTVTWGGKACEVRAMQCTFDSGYQIDTFQLVTEMTSKMVGAEGKQVRTWS